MIEVFPKYIEDDLQHSLTTQFIFKDSKGDRQVLNPAESLDSVGKVPQNFDGEDYAVAVEIMGHLKDKTVTVSPGDKAILAATLKSGLSIAKGSDKEPDKKATKKEIKIAVADALAEAEASHKAAGEKSAGAAQAAQETAVADALDGAEGSYKKAFDALQADHERAIKKAGK